MSTVNISRLNAADVLTETALPDYERAMDFFYVEQLVPLNANLYIVDKILRFPFDLFVGPSDITFFKLVVDNFLQTAVLTITRLATDKGKDLHTLLWFKNWVLASLRPQHKAAFREKLRQVKFDQTTLEMLERAKKVRDTRLAHTNRDYIFKLERQDLLDFSELLHLRDRLNRLLATLSFNVDRLMLPIEYDPRVQHPPGADHRSDIERVLDCLARDSHLLNLPERNADHWAVQRERLPIETLYILNQYRLRFGLPKV